MPCICGNGITAKICIINDVYVGKQTVAYTQSHSGMYLCSTVDWTMDQPT